jgi:DeoR family glycerol-3-phosphate regulon repressor
MPTTAVTNGKVAPVRKRHEKIKKMVQAQGFVTIETLAQAFSVTPQTIRRDIHTLSKKGLLYRYHGGAAIPTSTENVAYKERKVLCFREKQKIAQLLAQQIPDNASLFINIGTTTEAIAHALGNHKRLRVITNNLNVASIMSANEKFEVIVAGGLVRHRDQGIIGEATIDFISQFKVDYGIIGISGIDLDGTLLDFDYREVRAASHHRQFAQRFPGRRPHQIRPQRHGPARKYCRNRLPVHRPPSAFRSCGNYRRIGGRSPRRLKRLSRIASRSREHFSLGIAGRLIFHLRKRSLAYKHIKKMNFHLRKERRDVNLPLLAALLFLMQKP